jgi:hypothetical protein
MTDGYVGYQHLLSGSRASSSAASASSAAAGPCRNSAPAASRTGPATSSPSWARRTGPWRTPAPAAAALDQQVLDDLRERYDTAVKSGIIHNRLRDWGTWNHPGYSLACWLRDYKEQVFLFTRDFSVDWTNNISERGAKAAKRHQAISGYWCSLGTLARWCRLRSFLDSAAAHGITALDALEGRSWLPPLPAIS